MAQYKTGTVSVTNGSATVTGSGTSWSGEIAAGDLFTIVGDNAWYEVASIGSNTSITLSANYAGTTGSGKSYAISRDFTTRLALPYPQKGDIETASIIKRAFEQIDTETNIATANYSATTAPTANDDSGDGYSIGSWWVNVTSDEAYLCVDSTVGAAVWTKISVDVPSEIVALLAGQSVSMASLTLSGGTANGVLYLNGSKVATSGSALTFDGGNQTITAATNGVGFRAKGSASNTNIDAATSRGGTIGLYNLDATNGNANAVEFYNSNELTSSYISGVNVSHSGRTGALVFGVANGAAPTEGMRLTSTGLGIGTSSPAAGAKLTVNGGIFATSNITAATTAAAAFDYIGGITRIISYGPSTSNYGVFTVSSSDGTSTAERMRIDSSGNLLVGTTSSKSKTVIQGQLSVGETGAVSGAAGIYLYANDALSDNSFLCRQSSGTGTTTWYIGNQAITTSSDIRLKENVKPSERNALKLLNQWEIIDHTWNDPSDKCENNRNSRGVWTGISAQQVQQVTPWLVNKPIEDVNEDGSINPWTMDFGYAVPLLVKAIQEQQAQIESLRKRLADAGIA